MLDRLRQRLSIREWALAAATAVVIVTALLGQRWLLPSYQRWAAARSRAHAQAQELARLNRNLQVRASVDQRFAELGATVFQSGSPAVALSGFLREIERTARLPRLRVVSMKPLPAEEAKTATRYPVQLSVAGPLPAVTQFVSELTHSQTVTGLASFSLRGVQGGQIVECELSIWMVRLAGQGDPEPVGTVAKSEGR